MPNGNDPLEFAFALLRPYLGALNILPTTAEHLAARVPQGELPSLENILSGAPPDPEDMMLGRIRALPGLIRAVRQFRKTLGSTPTTPNVPPEQLEQAILRTDVERILRGPFFHGGTPIALRRILERGFDPARLGKEFGLRFGEPAGVSLTSSPQVAAEFSRLPPILRVQPTIRPEQVLSPFLPEGTSPLLESYLSAIRGTQIPRQELLKDIMKVAGFQRQGTAGRESLLSIPRALQEAGEAMVLGGRREVPERLFEYLQSFPSITRPFNMELSRQLQQRGFEALLQSPRRYREFELRVFDPRRAVPLEQRMDLPKRFFKPKLESLEKFGALTPEEPSSLSDIYKQVSLETILGTR